MNGSLFNFIFEPLCGFDPPMASTKALSGAITEMDCSIVPEISTNSSEIRLGSFWWTALFAIIVEKLEKMPSQTRKLTDRVENGTSSSRQHLSFELSGGLNPPS